MRNRWWLALIALPLYAALIAWLLCLILLVLVVDAQERGDVVLFMFTPAQWELHDEEGLVALAIPVVVLVFSQCLFLVPRLRLKPLKSGKAASLTFSMISAGLVAAVLSFGMAAALFALWQLMSATTQGYADPADVEPPGGALGAIALVAVFPVSWILWSIVLVKFCRRRHGRGVYERIVGVLLGGTVLEAIVVLPLDIMIRRKTDCYCAAGSFWTLCISAWALLWLTGPGILIAATSKRRELWWDAHCINCGYAKGPSPGATCPECGHAWGNVSSP